MLCIYYGLAMCISGGLMDNVIWFMEFMFTHNCRLVIEGKSVILIISTNKMQNIETRITFNNSNFNTLDILCVWIKEQIMEMKTIL